MDQSTKIAYAALAAAMVIAFALLATRAEAQASKSAAQVVPAQAFAAAPSAPAAQSAPIVGASEADTGASGSSEPPSAAALPPPPPGYAYVAVADAAAPPPPASRAQLSSELDQVDERMRDLQRLRAKESITGPIVMMATGFGVALVSGTTAIVSVVAAEDVEGRRLEGDVERDDDRDEFLDINDDGKLGADDEDSFRRIARFATALSVVSAGVGVGGTVWFASRMHDRNEYNPELRDLKDQHRYLRRQLNYGAAVAPEGMRLSVQGRF